MPPTFNSKQNNNESANELISKFSHFSQEDKLKVISYFIAELKKFDVSHESREISIPAGVFANELSSLEAAVKYLKENQKLRFSKIAKLLNRSGKTIWATYHNAIAKMPDSFGEVSGEILIPVSAFSNRSYSALESLVGFIKDLDYSNHEVALMLHLDDRTIWTVYDRVKKKRGVK